MLLPSVLFGAPYVYGTGQTVAGRGLQCNYWYNGKITRTNMSSHQCQKLAQPRTPEMMSDDKGLPVRSVFKSVVRFAVVRFSRVPSACISPAFELPILCAYSSPSAHRAPAGRMGSAKRLTRNF